MNKYYSFFFLFISLSVPTVFAGNIDSLLSRLTAEKNPAQQGDILIKLSEETFFTDIESSRQYRQQALQLAEETGNTELKAKALYLYAINLAEENMYDSVLIYQQKVRDLISSDSNNILLARSHNETGIAYEYLGDYKQSTTHYFDALRLFERVQDKKGMSNQFTNIGLIFLYRKRYAQAYEYFEKAIERANQINYAEGRINALNNYAYGLLDQEKYSEALSKYRQILAFDLQQNNVSNIGGSYNNIGETLWKLNEKDSALYYYLLAEKYKMQDNDYAGLVTTYNNLAIVYAWKNNDALAEKYLNKALHEAKKYNLRNLLPLCYETQYKFYKQKKKYAKALDAFQQYVAMQDSIEKEETDVAIMNIQAQHQVEKLNKELVLNEKLMDKEKKVSKIYLLTMFLFIITTGILVYSLISVWRFNNKLKEHSVQIDKQNEMLILKNDELNKARNEAEKAAQAKAQFLSMMSHEIRTPLNAIVGVVNLLQNENKEHADVLKKSSEHLLSLINDILDLNKLQAGKVELEAIPFNLKKVMEDLHGMFQSAASEKGIELKIDFDKNIRENFLGDAMRLKEVLTNLVSNAIKFTDKGSVKVMCRLVESGALRSRILFEVTDTGIGIPENKQQEIFNSFTQVDSTTTRNYGGTGLGLTICKQLLQLFNADLNVKSKVGEGSTFYFTIDLENIEPTQKMEKKESMIIPKELKELHVLVAEDNSMNVYVMDHLMQKWGVKISVAENGVEVLRKVNETTFDLVLMDLHMPVMDGIEATRELRKDKRFDSLPIIAITATAEDEVKEKILQSGMNDYIMKPFKPDELLEKIVRYTAKNA